MDIKEIILSILAPIIEWVKAHLSTVIPDIEGEINGDINWL